MAYQIQRFKRQHLPEVKKIFDLQFGQDYLTALDLESYLGGRVSGHVAIQGGEVIGVNLVNLGTAPEISEHFLEGRDWFLNYFSGKELLALHKHLAIKPGFQGRGVGRMLVRQSLEETASQTMAFISVVWEESAGKSLGKILSSLGSVPVTNIKGYWAADSLEKQYDCPVCHSIPCTCSTTVFVRSREQE